LAGFSLDYQQVTKASGAKFSSSWTACANDVSLGYLDLCVGNYWITTDRIELGITFLVPTAQEKFKMLHAPFAAPPPAPSYLTWMKPLADEVWALIFLTWFAVGVMYWLLGAEEVFVSDPRIKSKNDLKRGLRKRDKSPLIAALVLICSKSEWVSEAASENAT